MFILYLLVSFCNDLCRTSASVVTQGRHQNKLQWNPPKYTWSRIVCLESVLFLIVAIAKRPNGWLAYRRTTPSALQIFSKPFFEWMCLSWSARWIYVSLFFFVFFFFLSLSPRKRTKGDALRVCSSVFRVCLLAFRHYAVYVRSFAGVCCCSSWFESYRRKCQLLLGGGAVTSTVQFYEELSLYIFAFTRPCHRVCSCSLMRTVLIQSFGRSPVTAYIMSESIPLCLLKWLCCWFYILLLFSMFNYFFIVIL